VPPLFFVSPEIVLIVTQLIRDRALEIIGLINKARLAAASPSLTSTSTSSTPRKEPSMLPPSALSTPSSNASSLYFQSPALNTPDLYDKAKWTGGDNPEDDDDMNDESSGKRKNGYIGKEGGPMGPSGIYLFDLSTMNTVRFRQLFFLVVSTFSNFCGRAIRNHRPPLLNRVAFFCLLQFAIPC
jgi:hypothetical protein